MARTLTYFAAGSLMLAATVAACAGDKPQNEVEGGEEGTGGSTVSLVTDPGALGGGDVQVRATPDGFTDADASGNPTYIQPGQEGAPAVFADALANLPAADAALPFHYPFADTMVPGNLTFIDFQWSSEIRVDNAVIRATVGDVTYHMYLDVECNSNGICERTLPKIEWLHLGKYHAGQAVTFDVVMQTDAGFTRSAPLTLQFSPEHLVGALYYWAAADNTINRVNFGADNYTPFIVTPNSSAFIGDEVVPPNTKYECVSCHSVSRDGTKIAFGVAPHEGENIAGIQVAKTADPYNPVIVPTSGPTPFSDSVAHEYSGVSNVARCEQADVHCATDNLGHNVALNPTGTFMAVNTTEAPENWRNILEVRSADVPGVVIGSYPLGEAPWGENKVGIHPEYSPDGNSLVVTLAENVGELSAWSNSAGSIAVVPVNPDGSLGASATVVATPPTGAYHFYPTWSPDGQYIAYMTAWDEKSLTTRNAVIQMTQLSTGTVTDLTRGTGYTPAEAQAGDGFGTTWPKFAPFAQGGGTVYFITFTTRRQRGLSPAKTSQLWMFGIDTKVAGDPSSSPFWLPWQKVDSGSLGPYWTEGTPCNADVGAGTCEGCLEGEACIVNPDDNSCTCEGVEFTK